MFGRFGTGGVALNTQEQEMGDELFHFVIHQRGKVLACLFTNLIEEESQNCFHLHGKFETIHPLSYTQEYEFYESELCNLGTVLVPHHPVFCNIQNIQNKLLCKCQVQPHSTCIAMWDKGQHPLLAEHKLHRVLGLNLVPASSESYCNFFDAKTTDCAQLLVNALHYLAHQKMDSFFSNLKRQREQRQLVNVQFVF